MSGKESYSEFLKAVGDGQERAITFAQEISEAGKTVKVEFSQQPRPPIRMESSARAHVFADVSGFVVYLQKYGGPNTVVLANPTDMTIDATLDEKSDMGREFIQLKPALHPLFTPWQFILQKSQVSAGALAEFVMCQRKVIVEPDGVELAHSLMQVKISKNITVHAGLGKHAINGLVCETIVQGQKQTETVELPDTLRVACPMFYGRPVVEFEVDLIVFEQDNVACVRVSSADVAVAKIKEFDDMVGEVATRMDNAMVVGLGESSYCPWNYVKQ